MSQKKTAKLNRRDFVKTLPAAGAAGLTLASGEAVAQPQQPQAPQRITKEMLHTAEQLIGIELTDAQETMALNNVNRALTNYESLRKINVPLDTPLATSFHPALPEKKLPIQPLQRGKLKLSKVDIPKFSSTEELAFCSTAQLAALVRTKKVSSVELTKMYLARLKRYSPKLLNVVTLTE